MNSPKGSGHFEITPKATLFETLIGVAGPARVACGVEKDGQTKANPPHRLPLTVCSRLPHSMHCRHELRTAPLTPDTAPGPSQGPGGTSLTVQCWPPKIIMWGKQVRSLVGELRSHMPCCMAKKSQSKKRPRMRRLFPTMSPPPPPPQILYPWESLGRG